jgi:hypothetical protein
MKEEARTLFVYKMSVGYVTLLIFFSDGFVISVFGVCEIAIKYKVLKYWRREKNLATAPICGVFNCTNMRFSSWLLLASFDPERNRSSFSRDDN